MRSLVLPRYRRPMQAFWLFGLLGMLAGAVGFVAGKSGLSGVPPVAVKFFLVFLALAACTWFYMMLLKVLTWLGILDEA